MDVQLDDLADAESANVGKGFGFDLAGSGHGRGQIFLGDLTRLNGDYAFVALRNRKSNDSQQQYDNARTNKNFLLHTYLSSACTAKDDAGNCRFFRPIRFKELKSSSSDCRDERPSERGTGPCGGPNECAAILPRL